MPPKLFCGPYTSYQEYRERKPDTYFTIDELSELDRFQITVPAFKVITVFDISQTEGKEFPDLSVKPLLADVEQYEDFFAALGYHRMAGYAERRP